MEPESPRETTQKLKFARPAPPKKPVKDKPPIPTTTTIKEEVPAEVVPSPEPSEPPRTTTIPQRPTPPTKPSKEKEPTAPSEKTEGIQQTIQQQQSQEDEAKGAPRPSPVRRQRPQPPVKPRTSTAASTGSAAASVGEGVTIATAAPTAAQVAESAPQPHQQQRPIPAKRPTPRKRMVTPQQSPSREAVPAVAAAAKEPAALPKELEQVKPSALVREPPVLAKDTKPQAAREMVVPKKEVKAEPEREEVKAVTAAKEEPVVPEKEVKPPPPKEPEILKKEEESVIKEAAIPEKEAKLETPVVLEKEEKQLVEGKVEGAAVGVERAVEKPEEKEEKLPPTPFDDIEETDTTLAEPEKINILQEEQLQAEGEGGKKDTENVKEQDDSKYVYEDMQSGEKSDNVPVEKAKSDNEYEMMDFDKVEREETIGEKESAVVTGGTVEEGARQQQQQQQQHRQAPGKVHQYDEVAMDEAEPRFKISSSKDFDGTLSSSSGYEHMEPAPAVRVANEEREPSLDGEYVPMKDGVIIEQEPGEQEREGAAAGQPSTDKYEYEELCEWVEKAPPIIRDVSPPYDSLSATRLTPSPGHNRPDELAPDAEVRRSVASSTGSVSSQKSLQTSSLEVKGGGDVVSDSEERRRGSSSASKKSSEAGSSQLQPERDAFGVRMSAGR